MTTKTKFRSIKPESRMSNLEKALWGAFWSLFIGAPWIAADFIRPLIYGA